MCSPCFGGRAMAQENEESNEITSNPSEISIKKKPINLRTEILK